jgi:hypothetical protein
MVKLRTTPILCQKAAVNEDEYARRTAESLAGDAVAPINLTEQPNA